MTMTKTPEGNDKSCHLSSRVICLCSIINLSFSPTSCPLSHFCSLELRDWETDLRAEAPSFHGQDVSFHSPAISWVINFIRWPWMQAFLSYTLMTGFFFQHSDLQFLSCSCIVGLPAAWVVFHDSMFALSVSQPMKTLTISTLGLLCIVLQ